MSDEPEVPDVRAYNRRLVWHLARSRGAGEAEADEIVELVSATHGAERMTEGLADDVDALVRSQTARTTRETGR